MIKKNALTLLLLITPLAASAVPVLWTLENVAFDSPLVGDLNVSGSFIFDADSGLFSSVAVSTGVGKMLKCSDIGTPGNGNCAGFGLVDFAGQSYDLGFESLFFTDGVAFVDAAQNVDGAVGDPVFSLSFAGPLTNAGGLMALDVIFEQICLVDQGGCGFDGEVSSFRSGGLSNASDPGFLRGQVIQNVSEPALMVLLGLGFAGLGFSRRWQG